MSSFRDPGCKKYLYGLYLSGYLEGVYLTERVKDVHKTNFSFLLKGVAIFG